MGKGMGSMSCRHKTVMAFGIVQLLMGLVVLASGIVLIIKGSWVGGLGHGIWGGLFIILTGILGLVGGLMKKRGLEIAFMVLSILSAASLWIGLMLISMGGMVGDSFFTREEHYNKLSDSEKMKCTAEAAKRYLDKGSTMTAQTGWYGCTNYAAVKANFAIVVMSGMLLLVAIVSSVMACCAVCKCCGANRDDDVAPYPNEQYA